MAPKKPLYEQNLMDTNGWRTSARSGRGLVERNQRAGSGDFSQLAMAGTGLEAMMTLSIQHVPSGYYVEFPAFLEGFSDAYNSEWIAEQVYGRMDPIATFAHTRRALSVSWQVPAVNAKEAKENMDRINALVSFLYPMYDTQGGATAGSILNMGPLWRVKFGNLIQNAATGGGLLGYVNGITMDPNLEMGMFTCAGEPRQVDKHGTATTTTTLGSINANDPGLHYYPKAVRLNFEMIVLHEHNLGWQQNGEGATFRGGKRGFPYATDEPATAAGGDFGSALQKPEDAEPNFPSNVSDLQVLRQGSEG